VFVFVLQAGVCLPSVYLELRHQRGHPEPTLLRRRIMMGLAFLFVPAAMILVVLGLYLLVLVPEREWQAIGRTLLWMAPALAVTVPYGIARMRK
jgi:hypothetical protein